MLDPEQYGPMADEIQIGKRMVTKVGAKESSILCDEKI